MNSVTAIKKNSTSDRELTGKQKRFAHLVCNPEYTLIAAYREAYATNASDKVCSVEADRLKKNSRISLEINRIKAKIDSKTILKGVKLKDHVISRLLEIGQENNAAGVKALELLGRSEQLFADKKVSSIAEQSSDQIEKELIDRLAKLAR